MDIYISHMENSLTQNKTSSHKTIVPPRRAGELQSIHYHYFFRIRASTTEGDTQTIHRAYDPTRFRRQTDAKRILKGC